MILPLIFHLLYKSTENHPNNSPHQGLSQSHPMEDDVKVAGNTWDGLAATKIDQ